MNFLNYLHKTLSKYKLIVRIAIKLRNQCDAIIGNSLSDNMSNVNLSGEKRLIELIAPQSNFFIDVGSNVGDWSLLFLKSSSDNCRGICIDPDSRVVQSFLQKLESRLNQITFLQCACTNKSGHMTFYESAQSPVYSSLIQGSSNNNVSRTVEVKKLDDIIFEKDINHVDYLKIDTEGYDFNVILGAHQAIENKVFDIIQFEYGGSWMQVGNTLNFAFNYFYKLNYSVFLLKADGLHKLNLSKYGEYFYPSIFVAVSSQGLLRVSNLIVNSI